MARVCWVHAAGGPSAGIVLGQRLINFAGIKPAISCETGPTLNRHWMGRPTSCVSEHHVASRFTGKYLVDVVQHRR